MDPARDEFPLADTAAAVQGSDAVAPVEPDAGRSVRGRDLLVGVLLVWGCQIALGVGLVLCGGRDFKPVDHPMAVMVASMAGAAMTALVSWYFVCFRRGESFREGFRMHLPSRATAVACVLTGFGCAVVGVLLMAAFATGKSDIARLAETIEGKLALTALGLLLPVVEEMYYRGFAFPVLSRTIGAVPAIVVVTLWFAAAHVPQLAGDWVGVPVIVALGAVWTVQRHVTGSLVPSLITHWVYNVCLVVPSLLVA